jgi:transcriptional regulator with XRE-family HTH domain
VTEETLGTRIRRLWVARGMTLDQLALSCSPYGRRVSRGMVQHWETGQHAPTLVNFAALAQVLDVSSVAPPLCAVTLRTSAGRQLSPAANCTARSKPRGAKSRHK